MAAAQVISVDAATDNEVGLHDSFRNSEHARSASNRKMEKLSFLPILFGLLMFFSVCGI
jgi:hypothetical protein